MSSSSVRLPVAACSLEAYCSNRPYQERTWWAKHGIYGAFNLLSREKAFLLPVVASLGVRKET